MTKGFKTGAVDAGLKKAGTLDLGLIYSESEAAVAAVFTTNQVQAAPVILTRERVRAGSCRAVVVNSGNANCCTGSQGMTDARATAGMAAEALQIPESSVLVASTGVIGKHMDMDAVESAIPRLAAGLSFDGWPDLAQAIMTTDTVPKVVSREIQIGDQVCKITGAAKGAGMIRPDMATMLCFVATDAAASPETLQKMLKTANDLSFNRITIDGDTSTNDMVLVMANGAAGVDIDQAEAGESFQTALNEVLTTLAKMIVRDGEGATKFVEVRVKGANSDMEARKVADTVANSSLVKTALFGEDANWGRIMAAVGRSGAEILPASIDIYFDAIKIVQNGEWAGNTAESQATQVIRRPEFRITIDLNHGAGTATVWTCDFSIDYVKINADYRT
jgi:glutamate N-acetyltransferase/amino-acid N-acetyltransferase